MKQDTISDLVDEQIAIIRATPALSPAGDEVRTEALVMALEMSKNIWISIERITVILEKMTEIQSFQINALTRLGNNSK